MTQIQPVPSYRQVLLEANASAKAEAHTPENYFSTLSIAKGAIAGLIGSVIIMIVISALTVNASMDFWLAPRFIASAVIGEAAWSGVIPILLGTFLHLLTGTMYGMVFALVLPRLPRPFWFVAGIIFGVLLWGIAAFVLPLLSQASMMNDTLYVNALIIAHLVFGITLGIAGSFFGKVESE